MAGGRPTKYTEELAEYICNVVATNTGGIKSLCAKYDAMPDDTTISAWRWKYPEFSRCYALAKLKQAEIMVEELEDVASDVKRYHDSEGNERIDSGSVAQQRLRCDNRKWMAAKLIPKLYGDQKQIDDLTKKTEEQQKELHELKAKLEAQAKKDY